MIKYAVFVCSVLFVSSALADDPKKPTPMSTLAPVAAQAAKAAQAPVPPVIPPNTEICLTQAEMQAVLDAQTARNNFMQAQQALQAAVTNPLAASALEKMRKQAPNVR